MNKLFKFDISAYLWPLLFWKIIYIKPLLLNYEQYSQIILLSLNLLIIFIFIIITIIQKKILYLNRGHLVLFVITYIFLFNMLINPNEVLNSYFYMFLTSSVLLTLLLLNVNNYKLLLRNYCYLAVIAILFYGFSPLYNSNMFADYMDYGYSIALPGFLGIYLLRRYFRKKWLIPLEILTWFMLILFSNRGALLSAVIFIVIYNLFTQRNNIKSVLKWFFLGILTLIVYKFLPQIFTFFFNILDQLNYNSYSINKLRDWLIYGDTSDVLSSRDIIADNAIEMIRNNLLFGTGIGTFEVTHKTYSHSIFLDVLLYWGIFGLISLIYFTVKALLSMMKQVNEKKVLLILLFGMWFPKLLLSGSFLYEPSFWGFISISIVLYNRDFIKHKKDAKYYD